MRQIDEEVMSEHDEHEPFNEDCLWQDIGGEG